MNQLFLISRGSHSASLPRALDGIFAAAVCATGADGGRLLGAAAGPCAAAAYSTAAAGPRCCTGSKHTWLDFWPETGACMPNLLSLCHRFFQKQPSNIRHLTARHRPRHRLGLHCSSSSSRRSSHPLPGSLEWGPQARRHLLLLLLLRRRPPPQAASSQGGSSAGSLRPNRQPPVRLHRREAHQVSPLQAGQAQAHGRDSSSRWGSRRLR